MNAINPYDGRTESLLGQYNQLMHQREQLGLKALALREELDKRSNVQGTIENAVIDGKAEVLVQSGVPASVIEEATRRVTKRREEKVAARLAREKAAGSEEVAQ
jgi:hypothetical protein